MKTGWKPRWIFICIILVMIHIFPLYGSWDTWVSVKVLNTGKIFEGTPVIIEMKTNEIIGLEFIGYFRNNSPDKQYYGQLRNGYASTIPDYFEDWEDKSVFLAPDERATLTTILYIHPTEAGIDTFSVWSTIRKGPLKTDPLNVDISEIILQVTEADPVQYPLPSVVLDPLRFTTSKHDTLYTQGLSNQVSWIPAISVNLITQDLFYFHADEYGNLQQSVERLFKGQQLGPQHQIQFDNLENGVQYGYIARAVYRTELDSTLTLYSDAIYSAQDNAPPERIVDPLARIVGPAGRILLQWNLVEDQLSGVSSYRIYRSMDNGPELMVADSSFHDPSPYDILEWYDEIDTNMTYYYRIHAVDHVGNEGDGDRSNGLYIEGDNFIIPTDITDDPKESYSIFNNGNYLQGTIDTLRYNLDIWEEIVRFQAVRDSMTYFENSPYSPMYFFDSGWIPRQDFWIFDYSYNSSADVFIDPNFVNNHTYYRRILRASVSDTVITYLGDTVPDCFPPADIHNLQADAYIKDPDMQFPMVGFTDWTMRIDWNSVQDGASGLKCYHVFRKIEGVNDDFIEIAESNDSTYMDDYIPSEGDMRNPMIHYRIVAEDFVGNIRRIHDTGWESKDRSLSAPILAGPDTLFTDVDQVVIKFENFDFSDVQKIIILLNNTETVYTYEGVDSLTIPLATDMFSRLRMRVLYQGERSSVWSSVKVLSKHNMPPVETMAWNDPEDWEGHIYLQWNRASVDNKKYEVWRRGENESWYTVDKDIFSQEDTIRWTDYYDIDELSDYTGDALLAYKQYMYKIRMITTEDDTSKFSPEVSTYCNLSPRIVKHDPLEEWNGKPAIKIMWNRAKPSIAQDTDSWITRVWISRDSLINLIGSTDVGTDVVDDTVFYWNEDVQNGHNYIFRIRETVPGLNNKFSGKSMPYTVNMAIIDSLFVQPQPRGNIFLSWEEDTLVDQLPVDQFQIMRIFNTDTIRWIFPSTVTSFMDNNSLVHGLKYEYHVSGLNDLGQVVAFNTKRVVCDTGPVFIPEDRLPQRYFNQETISVMWNWNDINGSDFESPNDTTTRGADQIRIQVSASNTFPDDPVITEDTGWFKADPKNRSRVVSVPIAVKQDYNNNTILFSRITAKDRWGHPSELLWSPDFFTMQSAAYDSIRPQSIKDLTADSSRAYYGEHDEIILHLSWTDSSIINSEELLANVDGYWMQNIYHRPTDTLGWIKALPGITQYSFEDTVSNRPGLWRVVSVDSAGNFTSGDSTQAPYFIPTPSPPTLIDFLECSTIPNDSIWVEYFFEIAMDPDHFHWAYEMGFASSIDTLLCQSGWLDTNYYQCITGWGTIEVDTTWCRVKARILPAWESGWSSLSYYTNGGGGASQTEVEQLINDIPTVFKLEQNYPNPFNAQTIIPYQLPDAGHAEIHVYNLKGSLVRTLFSQPLEAGHHSVVWDGRDDIGNQTASGIYMITIFVEMNNGQVCHDRIKTIQIK